MKEVYGISQAVQKVGKIIISTPTYSTLTHKALELGVCQGAIIRCKILIYTTLAVQSAQVSVRLTYSDVT